MISDSDISPFRIQTARWTIHDFGNIERHFLSEEKNPRRYVHDFLTRHPDAAHFVCGYRGSLSARLAFARLLKIRNPRMVLCMEAPNRKTGLSRLLQDFYYRRLFRRCRTRLCALFAIGRMGCEAYSRLGVPPEKIFPTMYAYAGAYPPLPEPRPTGRPLRLIYIGEAIPAKGIPILLEAVARFSPEEIHLDFVGSDRMSLVADAVADPRQAEKISALGILANDEIPSVIADHDLLLLPSLNDGWGMVVTEAVIAGIGAVATDVCGSSEIIRLFDAGRVIPPGDVNALTETIEEALQHPETVLRWKKNARRFRPLTKPEVLAEFTDKVLHYLFQNRGQESRPVPPWTVTDAAATPAAGESSEKKAAE